MSKVIPILCYHKIGLIAQEGRFLNVEPMRLRTHIELFRRRGYEFLMARELAGSWPKRAVCLTFDDAYFSTMSNGVEVLNELDVPGSFYAVAGLVGQTSTWDGDRARPLADWKHLLVAAASGHEIGNHSLSHPQLATLTPEDQREEIHRAHHLLLENGLKCQSICYPYGSMSSATLQIAAELGYGVGLTLQRGIATQNHNLLALPRITVSCGDAIPLLLYKIFLRPNLPKSRKTVVQ